MVASEELMRNALKRALFLFGDICTVLALVGIPIAIPTALFPEPAYNFCQMTFCRLF